MFLYKTILSLLIVLEGSYLLVLCDDTKLIYVDRGHNVTLPCSLSSTTQPSGFSVMWVHHGNRSRHIVLNNGSLLLTAIEKQDAGIYECSIDNDTGYLDRYNVTVRTPPPSLVNVTVHASTILALILWNVNGDGGYPIVDFTAEYRPAQRYPNGSLPDWIPISPNHISPNSRQIDVYHLVPNASYWFRVWANNVLGSGPAVEVLASTLYADEEAELLRHFFSGVEEFDTRTWIAAVAIVMGTLVILACGTCLLLCKEWRNSNDDEDLMELVPNIILNPFLNAQANTINPRSYVTTIVKSSECPGPGEPRKV